MADIDIFFDQYSSGFLCGDEERDRNVVLKIEHTRNVCRLADIIARDSGLEPQVIKLAGAAALLHDFGRFEQIKRYNTFSDAHSVNHGELGAELLTNMGFPGDFTADERRSIIAAVRHHNAVRLPEELDATTRLITNIVRDADKLDIVEIVLTYHVKQLDNPQVTLNLSPEKSLTPAIATASAAGQPASYRDMKTFSDFAIIKLAWFFQLVFEASKKEFIRREFPQRLKAFVGDIPEARGVYDAFNRAAGEVIL